MKILFNAEKLEQLQLKDAMPSNRVLISEDSALEGAAQQRLPYEGIRVVELTHMVMGPTCGMVLADLGAEVIKVEPIGHGREGDNTRKLLGSGAGFFPLFNRNKKSLALDLKTPEGKEAVLRLIATADIFSENFKAGTMDRLGLGYDVQNMRSILRSLGPIATAEAFYTARVYDAAQAQAMGMVNAVVDDVFVHCNDLALEIALNAPLTIQAAKQAIVAIHEDTQDLSAVQAAVQACFTSKDYAEGRLAFAEKRAPQFTGQ